MYNAQFLTATKLRIYVGRDIFLGEEPLFRAIMKEAKRHKLAGCTVINCSEGFASETRGVAKRLLIDFNDSANLPVVMEIVDSAEKINEFIPFLNKNLKRGMCTISEEKILLTDYIKERAAAMDAHDEDRRKTKK